MNPRYPTTGSALTVLGTALILVCGLAVSASAAPRTVLGELFSSAG
jgi:hypothetical protein